MNLFIKNNGFSKLNQYFQIKKLFLQRTFKGHLYKGKISWQIKMKRAQE